MANRLQGVDAYWALCMALNVYLALFHGWSTKRMKSRDWKYLWTCYGLSLIPAIVYLFIDTPDRGKIYGPATVCVLYQRIWTCVMTNKISAQIWCWINPKWAFLRIATLYGIVWLALLGALIIYSIALTKAWHQRRALVGLLNPLNENPFAGVVTTDIEIVFSKADDEVAHDLAHGPAAHCQWASLDLEDGKRPYTVNVHGQPIGSPRGQRPSRPELLRLPSLTRQAALAEENHEAWLYARVAFLYFIAMIICWLPASINRLVTFIDPTKIIFGLNYAAIIFLPSQGFLNALVYCVSSQTAVKNVFRKLFARGHNRGKPRSAERIRDSDVVVFHETHYPNKDSAVEQPSRPPEFHRPMLHPRDS